MLTSFQRQHQRTTGRLRRCATLVVGCAAALVLMVGCGKKNAASDGPLPAAPDAVRSGSLQQDAGLEVLVVGTRMGDRRFAEKILQFAEALPPVGSELEKLWALHGLRIVAVPPSEVQMLVAFLSAEGRMQSQLVGQSPSWVEIARGPARADGQVVSLDVERIGLPGGALRLLARSWLEPVPSKDESNAPGAILRIDLVPQHQEDRTAASRNDPLGVSPHSIAAEDQGLIFSRLLARLSVRGDMAYVIVAERPSASWSQMAAEVEEVGTSDTTSRVDSARPSPKVGQVVRDGKDKASKPLEPRAAEPSETSASQDDVEPTPKKTPLRFDGSSEWPGRDGSAAENAEPKPAPERSMIAETEQASTPTRSRERIAGAYPNQSAPQTFQQRNAGGGIGPAAPRVPTVGEALLNAPGVGRTVVMLIPKVPSEFVLPTAR